MRLEQMLKAAKWLLLGVLSVKAGEAYSGQQILPQNPLDIIQFMNNLAGVDISTIIVILATFLFLLLIVVAIKKRRRRQITQVIYTPIQPYLTGK